MTRRNIVILAIGGLLFVGASGIGAYALILTFKRIDSSTYYGTAVDAAVGDSVVQSIITFHGNEDFTAYWSSSRTEISISIYGIVDPKEQDDIISHCQGIFMEEKSLVIEFYEKEIFYQGSRSSEEIFLRKELIVSGGLQE